MTNKISCANRLCSNAPTYYNNFCYQCSSTTIRKEAKKQQQEEWVKIDQKRIEKEEKIKDGECRQDNCLKKAESSMNFGYCPSCYRIKKCQRANCLNLKQKFFSDYCFEHSLSETNEGFKLGDFMQQEGSL
jgi:hypothetical protein